MGIASESCPPKARTGHGRRTDRVFTGNRFAFHLEKGARVESPQGTLMSRAGLTKVSQREGGRPARAGYPLAWGTWAKHNSRVTDEKTRFRQ